MSYLLHQEIPESKHNPFRLGRHLAHDVRSLNFPVGVIPLSGLKSVRWTRRIPVLDQGDLGSCTANAATGWLGTDNGLHKGLTDVGGQKLNEAYAIAFYEQETQVDNIRGTYPPNDTGSTGLTIGKVLKLRGLAKSYRHAFGLRATLSGLQHSPLLLGTVWYSQMFKPAASGKLTVGGSVAGGHEILLDELDVERKRVWIQNSWGSSWSQDGRAWLSWDDLDNLLQQSGDVVFPVPA